jgi:hypothetical protein
MRTLTLSTLATAIALSSFPALAQVTTRIETRPFYGATVTLEHGVRVFRPLPSHDRVIINPGGMTPLTLVIGDSGSYGSSSYSESYAGTVPGAHGGVGTFLPRGHRHHGHHRGPR